jgi:hypothetical protein
MDLLEKQFSKHTTRLFLLVFMSTYLVFYRQGMVWPWGLLYPLSYPCTSITLALSSLTSSKIGYILLLNYKYTFTKEIPGRNRVNALL